MHLYDEQIKGELRERLGKLEDHFEGDVAFYYGAIHLSVQKLFRDFIERLKAESRGTGRLVLFVNTPGGSAEVVEKLVEIIRFRCSDVWLSFPTTHVRGHHLLHVRRSDTHGLLLISRPD